jgi:hypothetical protein
MLPQGNKVIINSSRVSVRPKRWELDLRVLKAATWNLWHPLENNLDPNIVIAQALPDKAAIAKFDSSTVPGENTTNFLWYFGMEGYPTYSGLEAWGIDTDAESFIWQGVLLQVNFAFFDGAFKINHLGLLTINTDYADPDLRTSYHLYPPNNYMKNLSPASPLGLYAVEDVRNVWVNWPKYATIINPSSAAIYLPWDYTMDSEVAAAVKINGTPVVGATLRSTATRRRVELYLPSESPIYVGDELEIVPPVPTMLPLLPDAVPFKMPVLDVLPDNNLNGWQFALREV